MSHYQQCIAINIGSGVIIMLLVVVTQWSLDRAFWNNKAERRWLWKLGAVAGAGVALVLYLMTTLLPFSLGWVQ